MYVGTGTVASSTTWNVPREGGALVPVATGSRHLGGVGGGVDPSRPAGLRGSVASLHLLRAPGAHTATCALSSVCRRTWQAPHVSGVRCHNGEREGRDRGMDRAIRSPDPSGYSPSAVPPPPPARVADAIARPAVTLERISPPHAAASARGASGGRAARGSAGNVLRDDDYK
jgi:hypothetical protein